MEIPTSPDDCTIVIDSRRPMAAEIAEAQIRKWYRHFQGAKLTLNFVIARLTTTELGELFEIRRGSPYCPTFSELHSAVLLAQGNGHAWAKNEYWDKLKMFNPCFPTGGRQQELNLGFIEAFSLSQNESGVLAPTAGNCCLEHRTDSGRIGWRISQNGNVTITLYRGIGRDKNTVGVPLMRLTVPYGAARQGPHCPGAGRLSYPKEIEMSRLNNIHERPLRLHHALAALEQVNHLLEWKIPRIAFNDQFAKFLSGKEARDFHEDRMQPAEQK